MIVFKVKPILKLKFDDLNNLCSLYFSVVYDVVYWRYKMVNEIVCGADLHHSPQTNPA